MAIKTYTISLSMSCYRSSTRSSTLNYTNEYTNSMLVGVASGGSYYYGIRFYPTSSSTGETNYNKCLALYKKDSSRVHSVTLKFTHTSTSYDLQLSSGRAVNTTSCQIASAPSSYSIVGQSSAASISMLGFGMNSYGYCVGGYYNLYITSTVSSPTLVIVVDELDGYIYVGGLGWCRPYIGVNGVPKKANAYIGINNVPVLTKRT